MICTVIFDIGNVLVKFDWKTYVYGTFDTKTADALAEAIWASGHWDEFDRGVLSDAQIIELMVEEAPEYRSEIHMVMDHVGGFLEQFEYAKNWIRELKDMGYQVLYLSNYGEFQMEKNPQVLDFVPLMDGGVFSCHVKLIKPDPEIYRILCEKYDLDPQECMFIDDNAANIAAAKEFGLHAVLFEGYEKSYREIMEQLDAVPVCFSGNRDADV